MTNTKKNGYTLAFLLQKINFQIYYQQYVIRCKEETYLKNFAEDKC